jgi:hypothetical protein
MTNPRNRPVSCHAAPHLSKLVHEKGLTVKAWVTGPLQPFGVLIPEDLYIQVGAG